MHKFFFLIVFINININYIFYIGYTLRGNQIIR